MRRHTYNNLLTYLYLLTYTCLLTLTQLLSYSVTSTCLQILRWTFGPVKCVEVPLYEVESLKETRVIDEELMMGRRRSSLMTFLGFKEGKSGGEVSHEPALADRPAKTILQLIDGEHQTDLLCTPHPTQRLTLSPVSHVQTSLRGSRDIS